MEMGIWAVPLSNRRNIQDFCTLEQRVGQKKKEEKGLSKPHKSGFWEGAAMQDMKGEFAHVNISFRVGGSQKTAPSLLIPAGFAPQKGWSEPGSAG